MHTDLPALVTQVLDTHHALLRRELPRLGDALADAPPPIRAPFAHLRRLLDEHLRKEETVLFPAMLALAESGTTGGAPLAGLVAQMEREHDEIRLLETALREAARDAGPHEAALLALLDDLVEHTDLEDDALFPAALKLELGTGAPPAQVLRRTRGRCGTCHADVTAVVSVRDGGVWLDKVCPEHGVTAQRLSTRTDYWAELDQFYFKVNDGEYPQRDYIVRMTERCNLACPICLAKANTEDTPDLDLRGLERLISERRGIKIDLMAAEPTLRPDLVDWVKKVKASGNIAALHTNGIRLTDGDYVAELAAAGVDEVFLQFDGLDDEANKALRGRPLLKARTAALANLRAHGLATSLIVVIGAGLNDAQVGETFRFALRPENDHVREVFYLGLRSMGSARHTGVFAGQQLMPDDLIERMVAQVPEITREDVLAFNKVYFSLLSTFHVRKCLYVQHYLVERKADGGFVPISKILDLGRLSAAATRYADQRVRHPAVARARFGASLVRQGLRPESLRIAGDLLRLENLFEKGMNLSQVPRRFLLIGFITACDLDNFDAQVAVNCGKGELSTDGGFTESGAVANVLREARFVEGGRDPGPPSRFKTT